MKEINIDMEQQDEVLSGDKYSAIQISRRCEARERVLLCSASQKKNRILAEAEIEQVLPILVTADQVLFKESAPFICFENFLEMEGFDGATKNEFINHYQDKYGIPFQGYLHIWNDFRKIDEPFLQLLGSSLN